MELGYWQIKIHVPGYTIHIASKTKPEVQLGVLDEPVGMTYTPFTDTRKDFTDELLYMDWSTVTLIAIRLKTLKPTEETEDADGNLYDLPSHRSYGTRYDGDRTRDVPL